MRLLFAQLQIHWVYRLFSYAVAFALICTTLALSASTIRYTAVSAAPLHALNTPDTWSPAASMSVARSGHTATLLRNGKVLVVGGYSQISHTLNIQASAELYDPLSDSWSSAGTLSLPRADHTATLLDNGSVLVAGGRSDTFTLIPFGEVYNPETNSWSVTENLNIPRILHKATLLSDGRALIAGGYNLASALDHVEAYDPASNTWTVLSAMQNARHEFTLTPLSGGTLLVAGGYNATGDIAAAELYNSTTNSWTAAGSLHDRRSGHSAARLSNGKVLIMGGGGSSANGSSGVLSSAELYDSTTNSWSYTSSMPVVNGAPIAISLIGNRVLVVGGTSGGSPWPMPTLATTTLYDGNTNTWSPGPNMSSTRALPTATDLGNGKVLVVGGYPLNCSCADPIDMLASAELYSSNTCQVTSGTPCPTTLALTVSGPTALTISGGQYAPNPFTITGTVRNTGTADAQNVQVTLYLPAGLEFTTGAATQTIGTLAASAEQQLDWSVRATGSSVDATLNYFLVGVGSNVGEQSVLGQISIPGLFAVTAITPNRGGVGGSVTVHINGSNFENGMTVKLMKSGGFEILGTNVQIGEDRDSLVATFDLTEKPLGVWDLVVIKQNNVTTTLIGAFSTETAYKPNVDVELVMPSAIRPGQEQTFNVVYFNNGNADAVGVPLWITGIPKEATVRFGFEMIHPPTKAGEEPIDWSQVPIYLDKGNEKWLSLFLGVVRAGERGTLPFKITFPSNTIEENLKIRAWASTCYFRSPLSSAWVDCLDNVVFWAAEKAVDKGIKLIPGTECVAAAAKNFVSATQDIYDLIRSSSKPTTLGPAVLSFLEFNTAVFLRMIHIETVENCVKEFVTQPVRRAVIVTELIIDGLSTIGECYIVYNEIRYKVGLTRISKAIDPNDKFGPSGAGISRFISADGVFSYQIIFENKPDATAPAQEVVVSDQLDMARLDLSTFSLGPINFGDTVVTPPPGLRQYATDVDLRPTNNLIVRINAGLDEATGLVTWRFISLDPATGLPTTDPLAGFLPPNKTAPEGDGGVFYFVSPKAGLATGAEIRNKATIVFDTNAPIDTPEWLNTIDNSTPTSQVAPLAATQTITNFVVTWSGSDTGSGIQDYSVFVSENGAPYTLWMTNTTTTSSTFTGQVGKSYTFYSVARDKVGHREDAPATPDATTQINPAPATATITIIKEAQPKSKRDFGFAGSLGSFLLDDAVPNDHDAYTNTKTFTVNPGVYTISEQASAPWLLAGITCSPAANTAVDLAKQRVAITANAGQKITCTFTNQMYGTIRAEKYYDHNGNGRRDWFEPNLLGWKMLLYNAQNTLIGAQVTNLFGKVSFTPIPPGNYTICEDLIKGWLNRQPRTINPAIGKPCYTLVLGAGQVAQATFGNNRTHTKNSDDSSPDDHGLVITNKPDHIGDETANTDEEWLNTADGSNTIYLPLITK